VGSRRRGGRIRPVRRTAAGRGRGVLQRDVLGASRRRAPVSGGAPTAAPSWDRGGASSPAGAS
jgi:hypothetical protein